MNKKPKNSRQMPKSQKILFDRCRVMISPETGDESDERFKNRNRKKGNAFRLYQVS